jgi:prolyl-tRNA editing enzyme YbaK/EbsC (Cys-tRNA(Pro) deacylase)
MSLESVRTDLAARAPDLPIIEVEESTATVLEAARALGVAPARIAKTLAVRAGDLTFLLVARGDARLDNRKTKDRFGARPRMLGAEETLELTGHPVGGVCPFGLATPLPVYCDVSLRDFDIVYPAAGSLTSSVEVAPERLADLVSSGWVDLCRIPEGDSGVEPGMDEKKEAEAPPPGSGDSIEDASDEAVREMEKRRDGTGHAGAGDIG